MTAIRVGTTALPVTSPMTASATDSRQIRPAPAELSTSGQAVADTFVAALPSSSAPARAGSAVHQRAAAMRSARRHRQQGAHQHASVQVTASAARASAATVQSRSEIQKAIPGELSAVSLAKAVGTPSEVSAGAAPDRAAATDNGSTAHFRRSIELPHDPAQVFALVSDYSNAPGWDPHTVRAEKLTPGPVRVGTRFNLVGSLLGMEMDLPYEVRHIEPGRIVLGGGNRFFTYEDEVRVEPQGAGSRLSWDARIGLRGPMEHLGPLAQPVLEQVLRKAGDDSLDGVRRLLGPAPAPGTPAGTISLEPEALALRQRLHEQVSRVVAMADGAVRNHHITQDYHDLSAKAQTIIGGPDVNWATMAVWASRRAGQSIRKEDVPWLDEVKKLLGPLGSAAIDPIVNKVADAVAAGNREVYGEIAPCYVNFITAFDGLTQPDPERLREFQATFRPGSVEQRGQELLRDAFTNYYHAKFESDPKRKSELMLLANAQVGLHEQTRLQPYIAAAIPPMLERVVTEQMFTFPLAKETLQLGDDIPNLNGQMFPEHLRTIESAEARKILALYDRTPDTTKGSGADDWTKLSDRMNFIYDLFRSRQQDASLWGQPLPPETRAALTSSAGGILNA